MIDKSFAWERTGTIAAWLAVAMLVLMLGFLGVGFETREPSRLADGDSLLEGRRQVDRPHGLVFNPVAVINIPACGAIVCSEGDLSLD